MAARRAYHSAPASPANSQAPVTPGRNTTNYCRSPTPKRTAVGQSEVATARASRAGRTAAVAERLGLTQPRVSKDLSIIRAQWRGSMIHDFDEAVARELEKIDRVEREAWEAWERPRTPRSPRR